MYPISYARSSETESSRQAEKGNRESNPPFDYWGEGRRTLLSDDALVAVVRGDATTAREVPAIRISLSLELAIDV